MNSEAECDTYERGDIWKSDTYGSLGARVDSEET